MCNLWGNSSFFLKTDTMLKTKSFFSQGGFRVDYDPSEVRDSLFPHVYVWPAPAQSVPLEGLLNDDHSAHPGAYGQQSKTKAVFLTFLPPPDFLKQNKPCKQTGRLDVDLWGEHTGDSWSWGSRGGWQRLRQVREKGCLRLFLSSEAAMPVLSPEIQPLGSPASCLLTVLWFQNIFI